MSLRGLGRFERHQGRFAERRFAQQVGTRRSGGGVTPAFASDTLTFFANATDGETVTIGSTVYRLSITVVLPYDVLLGVTEDATVLNLVAAVNSGAGEGTIYGTGTLQHPDVAASSVVSYQLIATARVIGAMGNSIVTAETLANGLWGAGALQGGVGDDAISNVLARYPNAPAFLIRDFDPTRKLAGLERLYTANPGLTPVVAISDTIGVALDESKGGALGPELFVNGECSTDTGWTKGVGWTIGAGVAAHTGANGSFSQAVGVTGGGYLQEMDVVTRTGGTANLQFGTPTNVASFTTTGRKSSIGVSLGVDMGARATSVFEGSIDNLTAKRIAGNHASATVRGVLQDGYHPGPIDAMPEQTINGTFDVDADWVKGTGWTISGGAANGVAVQVSNLTQPVLAVGKTYRVIYTTLNISAGNVRVFLGGTALTASITNGTFTQYGVCTTNTTLFIQKSADFVGSVDNISVKEVPANAIRKVWNGDGIDDSALTGLLLGPVNTAIALGLFNVSSDCMFGCNDAAFANLFSLASVGAGGNLIAGFGSSTVTDAGVDVRGHPGVFGIRNTVANGAIFRKLLKDSVITKTEGAYSGVIPTTVPIMFGARNNNGAVNIPLAGQVWALLIIAGVAATDHEVTAIMNQLAA